jgi:hypothetical protein
MFQFSSSGLRKAAVIVLLAGLIVLAGGVVAAQPVPGPRPGNKTKARVSPKDANLQNAVVSFAQRNLGKTVLPPGSTRAPSDAQCTDLAEAALISAGGKTEAQLGPTGPDDNYVWGTLHRVQVARGGIQGTRSTDKFDDVVPGDLIQFRNALLTDTDGSFVELQHHTAIVEKNLGNGRIQVLQQNFNNQHFVTEGVINLANLKSLDGNGNAYVWVYHPVSAAP